MAKKKANANKGLGKGLSSLLGDSAVVGSLTETAAPQPSDPAGTAPVTMAGEAMVGIEQISPGPWQPRRSFDEGSLKDLAASIRQHGVVQPLLVREKPGHDDAYELIAGERRWRAAQRAGLHELPVLIRDADDRMAAEIALIENIQRHDLNAIEEASGYSRLMKEFDYTQEKLATIIGKSRSHLANMMRLLNLPQDVQTMITGGLLSAGQARPLIGHDDASSLAKDVAARNMSARQVESMVARLAQPKSSEAVEDDTDLKALEAELREKLGINVALRFNSTSQKGRITIDCTTLDQFDEMVGKLKKN
jgi:ParB family chromosome partitioning protein|tara:strand:+ start:1256 stop:2176 length:921 start_codon:yes stop_codon:yes gene_type:complete